MALVVAIEAVVVDAPRAADVQLADVAGCEDAASQYDLVASDLESALAKYNSCISDSEGHDDCSSEFSAVSSAQSDFESAVADYESECN